MRSPTSEFKSSSSQGGRRRWRPFRVSVVCLARRQSSCFLLSAGFCVFVKGYYLRCLNLAAARQLSVSGLAIVGADLALMAMDLGERERRWRLLRRRRLCRCCRYFCCCCICRQTRAQWEEDDEEEEEPLLPDDDDDESDAMLASALLADAWWAWWLWAWCCCCWCLLLLL